jgi:uncharacterized membrane protein YkvA (DUF1232 family)
MPSIFTHEEVTPLDAFFSFLTVMAIGVFALIALVLVLLAIPQTRFKSTLTELLAWGGFLGASGMVVSPLDLIPDIIPVIGWADDAGYVLLALACAYIGWKQRQRRLTTDPVIDMESTRRGRNERYANASSRYPSAATASQRARKAGWPPL